MGYLPLDIKSTQICNICFIDNFGKESNEIFLVAETYLPWETVSNFGVMCNIYPSSISYFVFGLTDVCKGRKPINDLCAFHFELYLKGLDMLKELWIC